jgi:hypothetical protein
MVQDARACVFHDARRAQIVSAMRSSVRDSRRRQQLSAAAIRRVSGSFAEHPVGAQSDPAPMLEFAESFAVENRVTQQIERAEEMPELPADIERWRWIVLGLGWGW